VPGRQHRAGPVVARKDQARETAERAAAANRKCVDAHPTFVRNLTTPTIARDVDRIREALGEDKIGYYGVSWGTALGAQYRTLFDAHVDKMLLDSVMPPDLNVTAMDDGRATAGENTFHDFASWIARYDAVYHFGTTEPDVAKALLDLWAELAGHPRGDVDGATVNGDARQPPPRLCGLGQAVGRPLQLVGHTYEPVTPIGWARDAGPDRRRADDDRGRRPRLSVVSALRRRRCHILRHRQDDVGVVRWGVDPGAISAGQRLRSCSRTSISAKPSRFSPRQ
jgi:pimeloyl-ACP methyl ester carboxylesterase